MVQKLPKMGLSAGTGKLCIFGHLGLVFIWSSFVSCLLLLLYYVICAPVLTEGTQICVLEEAGTETDSPVLRAYGLMCTARGTKQVGRRVTSLEKCYARILPPLAQQN